ncbi:MAG: hypothetical protein ACOZNI_36115 [Myxococcota bacterium]
MIALLALAGPAGACSRVLDECDGPYVLEGVPRNVLWVPGTCDHDGLGRVRGERAHRVTGATERVGSLLRVRRWPPLAAGATYRVGETTFTTGAGIDRTPPAGGELRGFVRTDDSLVFVFSPVEDDSATYLLVESWAEADPEARRVVAGAWTHTFAPRAPGLLLDRERALPAYDVIEARMPATIAVHSTAYTDCGPGPQLVPAPATIFRTRWVDAAGHATPWGPATRMPIGRAPGWVEAEGQ